MYYNHHDDEAEGCLWVFGFFLMIGVIGLIIEHIEAVIVILLVVILIAIFISINNSSGSTPAGEDAAKSKAEKEAKEKQEREEASYRDYVKAMTGTKAAADLKAASVILEKLSQETDPDKRSKILAFFDRYLPLMTEILEASKHGETDLADSVKRFTETVKAFSRSLYQVDDVVSINKNIMESLAISDGLYGPYKEFDQTADTGKESNADADLKKTEPEKKAVSASAGPKTGKTKTAPKAAPAKPKSKPKPRRRAVISTDIIEEALQDKLDEAILLNDFDTIRDMLDSGVISEFDVDEDVLEDIDRYGF